MSSVNRFLKDILWMKNENSGKINLNNIEKMMIINEFDRDFIKEVIVLFEKRIGKYGEKEFQLWFSNLHFTVPEEFQDEEVSAKLYEKFHLWFDKELNKLEKETKLSWQEQTEDINLLNEKARKAQLVIRHRLSEVQLSLFD